MNPPSTQYDDTLGRHVAACLLACALLAATPVYAEPPAAPAAATTVASHEELVNNDELDDESDGSDRLDERGIRLGERPLQPISADEEQSLLGDWGDSENED